ncbi:SDR family NAD(P)-dependent oxidoreductase [Wohlfahrtiimonas chitiniclastica]|uniref:SDR family NAD(P)-dependent oxidoreductase n=1 Tax=Wohlfahrtiimonas chitiniclastica TaxID=400946 RepID=UPI0007B69CF7|nr:SDR family NAD(P)-dependent oxidoreductase [Wohlfahrtiimonas chitiniclastica]KZX37887.1 benzil reductase [Wohlfahrtiimonas chitiniclastica]
MSELYIVTGASKGIGDALATQLEREGHTVLRLARTNPRALPNLITVDLTDLAAGVEAMTQWLSPKLVDATRITLINNAGTVEPIGVVGKMDATQISHALLLNVGAVMALTNAFVTLTEAFSGEKCVMNVSSGAAHKAYEGWAAYCATKAAVDHFTRVLFTEQQTKDNPVKVVSIAPGVIDTDMQAVIRSSTPELFPNLKRFIDYKTDAKLSTPTETAKALISHLRSEKMGVVATADVRD